MNEEIVVDPALAVRPATLRRISWQAIFGGLIITLAVQLLLTVLGISIGATMTQAGQTNFTQDAGMATAIWLVAIGVLSLLFGGWVSGRLSGLGRTSEGALHGLITWGAATLITVCILTSATKSVLGGMGRLLSQTLPMENQVAAFSPDSQGGINFTISAGANNDWNSIRQEARSIAQKNVPAPTGRSSETTSAPEQGTSAQLLSGLDRMFSHGETINPKDRDAVVNLLVTQDNMSRAEANQTVDRWINAYHQKASDAQNTHPTAQSISQAAMTAGWGSFIALLLGALAAMWGGSLGTAAYLRATARTSVVV